MTLLDKYPTSRHRAVSLYKIALNYENILDFKNAIFFYNKVIKEFPNQDESMLAYYNLAGVYKAHNEYGSAIINYEVCLKKGFKIKENILVIAELNSKIKNYKRALNLYKYYISKYEDEDIRSIYYKKADIYKEMADFTNANRVYTELGSRNLDPKDKYKILFYRTDRAYNNILSGLKKENISLAPTLIKTYMEISTTQYADIKMESLYRIGNIFEALHSFDSSKQYLDKSKYYWNKVLEEKALNIWSEKAKEKLRLNDYLEFNYPYLNGTKR
jgi:tetratricopeptide (TPR) repeat protein